ncbi:venom protein 302-like isoform X2 [Antedon mediterranea]|uniref:venom protein 302-like isoform X2 n=1 Tax=Antedon mediterranea TaxID=105859 RepID=UPI003AF974C8
MKVVLALVVVSIAISCIDALSCRCDDDWQCRKSIWDSHCKPGAHFVSGMCGCELTCSKIEGEQCGGLWDINGKCSVGLECVNEPQPETPENIFFMDAGVCRRIDLSTNTQAVAS